MVEGSILNMRQLLDSTCDDRELAEQIAEAFIIDTPLQLESLEMAIEQNDVRTAERVAHTIKGSAAAVGGESLRNVAFECEKCGRDGKLDAILAMLPALHEQYRLLHGAMLGEGLLKS